MTKTPVNLQLTQCWTLDVTNNWSGFRQNDDGSGWSLIQERTANPVNEITTITNTTGPAWATPAYDRNGNMTTIPRATGPSWSTLTADGWGNLSASGWGIMDVDPAAFIATYDAWNRLIKLMDGEETVQESQYDARNFRTIRKDYTEGTLSETRHFYYTDNWQDIEERLGNSTDPEQQNIWGIRYIDDLVLRDRTTENPLDERLYACQDANWNAVALTDQSGTITQRFCYQPFGTVQFLQPDYGVGTNDSNWVMLFTGRELDPESELYYFRARYLNSSIGRFISRDTVEYADGPSKYATYFVIGGVDPSGNKSCIFTMDASNPDDCKRWDGECRKLQNSKGSAYYRRAHYNSSILSRIKQHKCCDVTFVGHRGGEMTDGGIVTYADGAPRIVLPDSAFEHQLAQTFQDNGCSSCVISIVACGGNAPGARDTRTTIATRTGCTVYGAVPPRHDNFITIGHCPAQKWYTLNPRGEAEEDPRTDQSICAGPVPMERYDPADPVPINPIGPIPVY